MGFSPPPHHSGLCPTPHTKALEPPASPHRHSTPSPRQPGTVLGSRGEEEPGTPISSREQSPPLGCRAPRVRWSLCLHPPAPQRGMLWREVCSANLQVSLSISPSLLPVLAGRVTLLQPRRARQSFSGRSLLRRAGDHTHSGTHGNAAGCGCCRNGIWSTTRHTTESRSCVHPASQEEKNGPFSWASFSPQPHHNL